MENRDVWLREIPNKAKYKYDLVEFRQKFGDHIVSGHGGGNCFDLSQVFAFKTSDLF